MSLFQLYMHLNYFLFIWVTEHTIVQEYFGSSFPSISIKSFGQGYWHSFISQIIMWLTRIRIICNFLHGNYWSCQKNGFYWLKERRLNLLTTNNHSKRTYIFRTIKRQKVIISCVIVLPINLLTCDLMCLEVYSVLFVGCIINLKNKYKKIHQLFFQTSV